MSKARELAELGAVYDSGALSNRNFVINGAMMIAQRATSVSSQTGSGYKTVDRIVTNASGSTYNQSQQTVTVGGETGLPTQFTKFLRHDVTTSNDNAHFYHKIEGVASVPAGTVTLSFYAKGTTPTGGLAFNAYQNFGTGGSPSGEVSITISDTVTLTSTWQRFSINITVPSITGKTLGTNGNDTFYFGIRQFANTSTNAYQLDITGLQLEVGTEATPFEHRSFGDELARCKRYFERFLVDVNSSAFALGYGEGTSQIRTPFKYETKRSNPSLAVSTAGNWEFVNGVESKTASAVTGSALGKQFGVIFGTVSGATISRVYYARASAGEYIDLESEL